MSQDEVTFRRNDTVILAMQGSSEISAYRRCAVLRLWMSIEEDPELFILRRLAQMREGRESSVVLPCDAVLSPVIDVHRQHDHSTDYTAGETFIL